MTLISENIKRIKNEIPKGVKLIAISKTHPHELILEAFNEGQIYFGENKVQELIQKKESLPTSIKWHFIGHLQSNKIKYIASFIDCIHAVDSLKLLKEINKEALKNNRVISCLLQLYIATEDTKFGLNQNELIEILKNEEFNNLKNIEIIGLMGMASFTNDTDLIRKEFRNLSNTFKLIKNSYFSNNNSFCEISMGMSNDYKIAIEEGSTMIRLGTIVFGDRSYTK